MKRLSLCMVIMCFGQLLNESQVFSQNFVWARQANLKNHNRIVDVAMDLEGNSYMAGAFLDSADFGLPTLYSTDGSFYLAKYNQLGEILWVRKNSGNGFVRTTEISFDNENHIYVLGTLEGTTYFGGSPVTVDIGIASHFLAKYDTAGNFSWVKIFENNYDVFNNDSAVDISNMVCDVSGNIFIGGRAKNYTLDGIGVHLATTDYFARPFVAKLDSTGIASWVCEIYDNASPPIFMKHLVTDLNGNVIAGFSWGTSISSAAGGQCVFDGSTGLNGYGSVNSIVAKYSNSGDFLWAKKTSNTDMDAIQGVDADEIGNIYVTRNETGLGLLDKYNPNGQLIWSISGENVYFRSSFTSSKGTTYGYVKSNLYEDLVSFNNFEVNSDQFYDHLLKINSAGDVGWAKNVDLGNSSLKISGSANGTVLIGGSSYWERRNLDRNIMYNGDFQYDYIALLHDTTFTQNGTNQIIGNIFDDNDSNCETDLGDLPLRQVSVIALPGPFYATADSLGNYRLVVNSANYTVSQIPVSSHEFTSSVTCPLNNEYSVYFSSTDSVMNGLDFANDYNSCYIIEVEYGQYNGFTVCDSVRLSLLEVCNNGETVASNVSAIIQYPGRMIPLNSSIPWTSYNPVDSTMVFDLVDLQPDSCLSIIITDSVTCAQPYDSYSEAPYNYHAQVLPLNACYSSDTLYNYSSQSAQIDYFFVIGLDRPTQDEILVYPNPVANQLFVKGISSGVLEFYDVLGHLVQKTEINRTVSTTDIGSGLYVLKIFNEKGLLLKTTKLVVSK